MNAIKSSPSVTISWKNAETDGEQLFSCLLHSFSDEIRTTMKGNALILYFLHFAILSRIKQYRRKLIDTENTVLACLPTSYILPDQSKDLAYIKRYLSDLRFYKTFMNILKRTLDLFDTRFCRAVCKDNVPRQAIMSFCHITMHNWHTWINKFSIRKTVCTLFTSLSALWYCKVWYGSTMSVPLPNVTDMLPILSCFHCRKMIVHENNMAEWVSMHNVKHVFSEFPFLDSDIYNNNCSAFCFERRHSLFRIAKNVERMSFEKTSRSLSIHRLNVCINKYRLKMFGCWLKSI